jgi:nucleotidyltransferase/DNA polymerase involved in DNA repair
VQQWGSLLAVNYVARKFGIKRSASVWWQIDVVWLALGL